MNTGMEGINSIVIMTLFFSSHLDICTGAYFQPVKNSRKVTYDGAKKLCGSSHLPLIKTVHEHVQLTAYLELHKINAVWIMHKRVALENYMWLDGTVIDKSLMIIGNQIGHACGVLDVALAKYDFHSCSEAGLSYLCGVQDCAGCSSQGMTNYNCIKHGNTCYMFYCGISNWYAADVTCRNIGGSLAILKDKKLLQLFTHFWDKSFLGPCVNCWIGFNRETWLNTENSSISMWAEGEPKGANNCAVVQKVGEDFLWSAKSCNESFEFVCQETGSHNSGSNKPGLNYTLSLNPTSPLVASTQGFSQLNKGETSGWAIATTVGSLFGVGSLVAVGVFLRRKKWKYKTVSQP